MRDLQRRYWWKGMAAMCKAKVEGCLHCQRTKNRTKLPVGKMRTVEEPATLGVSYSVDFLTRLPTATKGRYDTLMVIQDRWSIAAIGGSVGSSHGPT